jgi:hypothetical protein
VVHRARLPHPALTRLALISAAFTRDRAVGDDA